MDVNDAFHGIVTPIISSIPNGQSQGTGFFYQKLASGDPQKKGPQWRAVEQVWLVTNRHVLLPKIGGKEIFPNEIAFHQRKVVGSEIKWEPITISKVDLLKRAKFHPNEKIDVCIIEVLDLLTDKLKAGGNYLQWHGVSVDQFPGKNNIFVEVADDVVVIGFPRGFYDQINLFPIVKSGIIASRWGANFNGERYFLIDSKLFLGSSGSIVVSKPKDFVVLDGKMMYSKEKQFAFLGIYSGEPFTELPPLELDGLTIVGRSGLNVGIVWYGELIEEILQQGIVYKDNK
jgi:hypothetical protein